MNIQISVVIWTVICFCLLIVILNNLLFKPVLSVMDKRKQRLSAAREKQAEYDRLSLEYEKQLEAQKEEFIKKREEEIKAAAAQIQTDEKEQTKEAQRKSLEELDAYREQLESDHQRIILTVSPKMEKVAEIFVQKFISDRTQ